MKTEHTQIAERIKELREKRGWSQVELATHAGIDRKTVSRIENEHFMPSMKTLMALSDALEIPSNKLLGA